MNFKKKLKQRIIPRVQYARFINFICDAFVALDRAMEDHERNKEVIE